MKRPTGRSSKTSQESTELGEKAIRNEQESTVATDMEQEEGVEWDDLEVDDVDELGGGERSKGLPGALGEKKRRLAQEQVCALERSFESDNKLDPVRKARIARDVGLQPRQVAVWFQNRRARWKTKQLERDFAALRARHDALYLECDALRRDKDILSAKIRELKEKANRSRTVAKLEAMDLATEERPITVTAAVAVFKDGFTDSDSSIVFNDVEASPYSSTAFDQQQPCLMGLGSFAGISGTSTSSLWELLKGGALMEDGLLGSADELSSAWFLADEHVSSLPWYGPGGSE